MRRDMCAVAVVRPVITGATTLGGKAGVALTFIVACKGAYSFADTPAEDTLHNNNLDVRKRKSGTKHCIFTAMLFLSKDVSM